MEKHDARKYYFKSVLALGLALVTLSAFIIVLGGYRFWETLTVFEIRFRSVKDLASGRPVKYGGLDVGRVLDIAVDDKDPRFILVHIGLDHNFALYEGTQARIAQKGLVGDYYIFLELTQEAGPRLDPGASIPALEALDVQQLAGSIGALLESMRPRLEHLADNLEKLLSEENAQKLTEALSVLPVLLGDADNTLRTVQAGFGDINKGVNTAANSLDKAMTAVNRSLTTLTPSLEKTAQEIKLAAEQTRKLGQDVRGGLDYNFEQLDDTLAQARSATRELRFLLQRLRERPWELINSSKPKKDLAP